MGSQVQENTRVSRDLEERGDGRGKCGEPGLPQSSHETPQDSGSGLGLSLPPWVLATLSEGDQWRIPQWSRTRRAGKMKEKPFLGVSSGEIREARITRLLWGPQRLICNFLIAPSPPHLRGPEGRPSPLPALQGRDPEPRGSGTGRQAQRSSWNCTSWGSGPCTSRMAWDAGRRVGSGRCRWRDARQPFRAPKFLQPKGAQVVPDGTEPG